jgi:hypothetical protein
MTLTDDLDSFQQLLTGSFSQAEAHFMTLIHAHNDDYSISLFDGELPRYSQCINSKFPGCRKQNVLILHPIDTQTVAFHGLQKHYSAMTCLVCGKLLYMDTQSKYPTVQSITEQVATLLATSGDCWLARKKLSN